MKGEIEICFQSEVSDSHTHTKAWVFEVLILSHCSLAQSEASDSSQTSGHLYSPTSTLARKTPQLFFFFLTLLTTAWILSYLPYIVSLSWYFV